MHIQSIQWLLSCIALSWFTHPAIAGGERCRQEWLTSLAQACASEDELVARDAINQLRSAGQDGLNALCEAHDRLSRHVDLSDATNGGQARQPNDGEAATIARLRAAIDAVSRQRDAHASRLYWFTDLDAAKSESARTGKPILSLRLLGNLDDDLSCANSRFFRSVLYANATVALYLREHFVLHWESLRPVPRLSIDFGDGRRIERTITGNSIHYVLDSQGEIIDAIPGLYGPAPFLRAIQSAEDACKTVSAINDRTMRANFLQDYHADSIARIDQAVHADLAIINSRQQPRLPTHANAANQPLAVPAATVATAKMRAEVKAVEAVIDAPSAIAQAAERSNDALWEEIAAIHPGDANLDQSSVALITSKLPADIANAAQNLTRSKQLVETPAMRMLRTFRQSIGVDSVRNEYELHRAIHEWLAQPNSCSESAIDLQRFNERVYAKLFLTPLDDPWMGLAPRDAYAALDGGGLIDAGR